MKNRTTKRIKYKIDYKKLGFLLLGVILLTGLIAGGIWFFWFREGGETKVYDVAVQLRDRTHADPKEDARSSAKKGDVILIRETGREWSTTEKISYLIIKMRLNEQQARKIVQPKIRKISQKEGKKLGLINDKMLEGMEKQELERILRETVLFREYRIKIEDMDFDPMKIRQAQPFPEKEFSWKIVEKK